VHVYIGSYTSNGGEGIYQYSLDSATGALALVDTLAGVVNPSFLALAPGGRFLYSVNEVESYYGKPEGALSAFAVEAGSGRLRFLNQQPSLGASPCHLACDQSGRYLLVANYGGANLAVLPILPDGKLAPAVDSHRHQGAGPHPSRQEAPHPHFIAADPFNRHVLAVDLGIDRVMAYALDSERGALRPAHTPFTAARPGSGPRHLAFHPQGKWAYVVHELQERVVHYAYHAKDGALSEVASHSCLPAGHAGENYPSGIQLDPTGKFLYVSNRGHDSIAHFRVDGLDGGLEFAGCAPTRGKFPRHFDIEPGGRFLVAANQRSDSLSVFRIEPDTGSLEWTGRSVQVPSPVCVRFGRA
jgi:6-phosphogluconolactonase